AAEVYDPLTGTWKATGSMKAAHRFHSASLLFNGKVLVAGGYSGGTTITNGAELFDPSMGTWTSTGLMNEARENHTATLLIDGRVLVTGGDYHTNLSSAEIYNPTNGTWVTTTPLTTLRNYHTATLLPNGKVLVAGGQHDTSTPLTTAALFDPGTGTRTHTGSLGTMRWRQIST